MFRTIALGFTAIATLGAASVALAAAATGTGPCAKAAALDKEVAAMHVKYNTLTANSQAAEKQALKAQIIARTNEMNAAKAACAKCNSDWAPQEAAIAEMHAKYNTLTANRQAAEKQALKAQIIKAQTALDAAKAACN